MSSPTAEAFGKTFDLDLFTLYELAADQYILRGDYGRALEYDRFVLFFHVSNLMQFL
jgi:hypothetical protein